MTSIFAYRVMALALLAGIGAERYFSTTKSPNVQAYDAQIRASASLVPSHIGPWVGQDIPVIERAVKLLAPNLMINRRYINVENGHEVGFLAVHCADAHDMVGHFPLRCYPAEGWNLQTSREVQWHMGERTITGMEYTFVLPPLSARDVQHTVTVDNFLLRPGAVLKDMDALSSSIIGAQGQAAGAGQFQICFHDDARSADERHAVVEEFVNGYQPVIDAILASIPS